MAEKKPLCFCGNCFTSLLHRLSDWATSREWILWEALSITRELAPKSFWVPIQCQLDIIYQDSTIRGCGLQKRWRAELLPPHCQRRCHLNPAMTDGQVGTHGKKKKGQQSLTRVSAILSLWETLEEYGLEQDWYQLTFSRVRAKLSRIIIYLSTVYSLTIVLNQRTQ